MSKDRDAHLAIVEYRQLSLELAMSDLLSKKCQLAPVTKEEVAKVSEAREKLLTAAAHMSAERFTMALVAANFLGK